MPWWHFALWAYCVPAFAFGVFTFSVAGLAEWTKKYTAGELVTMVVCWPVALLFCIRYSLPSIADKMDRAGDDEEDG